MPYRATSDRAAKQLLFRRAPTILADIFASEVPSRRIDLDEGAETVFEKIEKVDECR